MVFNFSASGSLNLSYSSTVNGKTDSRRYAAQAQINPDGTFQRSLYQNNDKPLQYTEEYRPSRQALQTHSSQAPPRRIEDVTESEPVVQSKEAASADKSKEKK